MEGTREGGKEGSVRRVRPVVSYVSRVTYAVSCQRGVEKAHYVTDTGKVGTPEHLSDLLRGATRLK